MYIYIYNLGFITVLAVLFEVIREKNKRINTKILFVILVCLQLIVIQGLRANDVGTDTVGYIYIYNVMNLGTFGDIFGNHMAFGFCFLVKIITLLGINYQLYLSILSGFIIVPVGYTIYKYSKKPFLSFYLYITFGFYSASFCTIRQHIAYGIILLTLGSIKQRKLWKFVLIVLIATTIHTSAFVFLPAYFITKMKLNKINLILTFSGFVAVFVFRMQIAEYVIKNYYTYFETVESYSYTWLAIGVVLFLLGILVYKQVTFNNDNHIYYILIVVALLLMLMASVTTNAIRVVDFYYIFLILYIPEIVDKLKNKNTSAIINFIIFICAAIIYFMLLTKPNGYGIIPYKFFWQ